MKFKFSYLVVVLLNTILLPASIFGQVEEVEITIGDSIQIVKTHQPPFSPLQVTFVESFTIPDPVDASIDSIRVNEQGNALLAYIKLKLKETAVAGERYQKNVTLLYLAGQSSASFEHKFSVLANSLTPIDDITPQQGVVLFQNYPNPVRSFTTIEYVVPEAQYVNMEVYNQLGQKIKTLVDQYTLAGHYEATFDGSRLPGGKYIYKMTTKELSIAKQFLLIK